MTDLAKCERTTFGFICVTFIVGDNHNRQINTVLGTQSFSNRREQNVTAPFFHTMHVFLTVIIIFSQKYRKTFNNVKFSFIKYLTNMMPFKHKSKALKQWNVLISFHDHFSTYYLTCWKLNTGYRHWEAIENNNKFRCVWNSQWVVNRFSMTKYKIVECLGPIPNDDTPCLIWNKQ